MLVETTHVTEFEYYFTCTRKGIYITFFNLPRPTATTTTTATA